MARQSPDRSLEDHWVHAKKIVQHGYGLTPLGWACALSTNILSTNILGAQQGMHPVEWADFQALWALWAKAGIGTVPLSRLFGYGWFCGRRFDLNEATLDPRWESEGIIALVRQYGLGKPWCTDSGAATGSDAMGSDAMDSRAGGSGAMGSDMTDSGAGTSGAMGSGVISCEIPDPDPDPNPDPKATFTGVGHRPRILDVGTGSGCLLITLLMHFKGALGWGLDYSAQALNAARLNGQRHGVAQRVQWIHSDGLSCFNTAPQPHGGQPDQTPACPSPACPMEPVFDIIVSNPPYVSCDAPLPDDVRQWDPPLALYAGKDGLDAYRAWIGPMAHHLAPAGILVVEIGWDQGQAVQTLCVEAGFRDPQIATDDDGKNRYVWAIKDA